ncbi:hypothetical protein ECEPECA12_4787 [Escherichia coli EPECa12]|nr:hypothetical protein ECEPECA12_4787 [Escherichia coli EPECa12]
MCIYLNLMILIKIIRGFISTSHTFINSALFLNIKPLNY